ncbi:hypothetical protein QBC34DRAFT_389651 [Podospora aff. communis PSN243]|uniref:SnoaL-like domain-containing protein n=1 Tax=Podospora aff. communis PSN243 TaxID=3040156 RepID=A0AAV9H4P7_9PEZI|nr:hypothetical protein QBC34DRAFT_389651 [Podospora aff. communis PSN243]
MASPNPNADSLYRTMSQTLHKFLHAPLEVSTANDPKLMSTTLDSTCTRHIRPTSLLTKLGAPPDFAFDVATYEKTMEGELRAFKTVGVEVSDVSVDTAAKTAAATAIYVNRVNDGREFRLEFSWHVAFTEGGSKIKRVVEWCDGIGFPEFQKAVAEAGLGEEGK